MLEKHLVYAGELPPRNFQNAKIKKRSMKAEDPMSHRIIEKRRRDRMNNCLADLSRLIPPEYLKKGRGRIEKTEIIEMAIKHMRHLQNIIASTRFNENSNSSVPSPPVAATLPRDIPTIPKTVEHPNVLKHYKMGYLECISEAMHFLVEVQGYFAGDSLCVQMTNHLHKHCDNILRGNSLNFLKKSLGETTYSDSSTSPINVTYNNSPPSVGMSNSIDSSSDENRWNQSFDVRVPEDGKMGAGLCSVKKYPDPCYNSEKHSDVCYAACVGSAENENLSDSEPHYQSAFKWRNGDIRREESNNNYEAFGNHQKNYQVYHNLEESGNGGLSQLKEMLTSSINTQVKDHSNKVIEPKGNISPLSNTSGYETSSGTTVQNFKTSPSKRPDSDLPEGDNHYLMYKFKNNIQQRFSKENGENAESVANENIQQLKKPKSEECQKYPDPLVKQRLSSMDRMDVDEERLFKFNTEFESRKKIRYGSESENQEDGIVNRLNFGRKTEKVKKLEELPPYQLQTNPKAWAVSPNPSMPYFGSSGPEFKPLARELAEYSPSLNNSSYHNLSLPPPETGHGVPIFALHAKGSFYIPLTLDHAVLAPFLTILGITKTDEAVPEKTVLHPVTISVNFQSHFLQ